MQSQFKNLFKHSVIYGLGVLSTKLVGFVLIPLYTGVFTLKEFGIISLLEITTTFIITLASMSIYSGFFRWYYDKESENKQKSLFFTVSIFQLLIVVVVYGIIFFNVDKLTVAILKDIEYKQIFNYMVISALLQVLVIMPTTLLRLQEKSWLFSLSNFIQLVIVLSLTVYFVAFKRIGIIGIYYGQIAGSVFMILFLLRYSLKNIQIKFESKLLKQILIYCFPLMFSGLALTILNITDRFTINYYATTADVGLYSYGFKIANVLQVFVVTSINFAIQPIMFQMIDKPDNKEFYSQLMTYYVLVVMFIGFCIMIFGREIAMLFALNSDYYSAWTIIPFIIFATVFGVMRDSMATTGLSITKKTAIIAFIAIFVAVLNIVLNIVLVPILVNSGAAIAKLLSMFISAVMVFIASQKFFKINYQYKNITVILLSALVLYLISMPVNSLKIFPSVLIKTAIVAFYILILFLSKIVKIEDVKKAKEYVTNLIKPSKQHQNNT